ncbi:MAG: ABC transporter substrate-binding protein [Betaproteobacteria bacterium]|nr:ABC transporter substrate-binding protein [Betaproteobacteria bacterium]
MNRKSGHWRAGLRRRVRADDTRRSTRRRLLLAGVVWPAVGWTGPVFAQRKLPVVIGWLHPGSRAVTGRRLTDFKEGMAALGWKEGANYVLEERWAEGRMDRLRALAEELKVKKPAVIVAGVGAVIVAAKAAPDVPVVQMQGRSPVAAGLAASLARPGGMVTGVTNVVGEVSEKYLELLLAAVPRLRRVGFLADVKSGGYEGHLKNARRAIERYRVEAQFAQAAQPEDLDPALSRLVKEGVEGLVILPSAGMFIAERSRIVKFALAQRWPVVAGPSTFAEEGALISYSADSSALRRRAAWYVDRILKGAKPGELPIEQPTKFEFVINMKTAKALGIAIPQSVLLRADRVIE